jgi:hypothetical protein
MEDILKNAPFILTFLGGVIVAQMTLGEKATTTFLILVLAGMILTNANSFLALIGRGISGHE